MVNHATADVLVDARASLGELPRWCAARERLLWLDVDRGLLHETDPRDGADRTHDVGLGVGALAPYDRRRIALGTRERFALVDLADPAAPQQPLTALPARADEILNDGACDPAGRFWAGSYARDERAGGGRLYCRDLDGAVRVALEHVTMSNGIAWSPDGRRMYYVDTPTQALDAFDYDLDSGRLGTRRRIATVPAAAGLPDGIAVDDEGAVWVAIWGGGHVRRYTPGGRLDRIVEVPADHVTACAFGGVDGTTLLVTSAAGYGDDTAARAQSHAGALFAVDAGVGGPPAHALRLPQTPTSTAARSRRSTGAPPPSSGPAPAGSSS
jgi:sugar lactone lactonase YvrE